MNENRKIDEAFLDEMMKRGEKAWKDVPDATSWVEELRNGNLDMTPKKHNPHSHPIKGINEPMSRIKKCDSCGAMVDIDKDSSAHGNCNQVWGRRGWRTLGEYDG